MDVRSPKGPVRRTGQELVDWAREQIEIAAGIVDNPGGGLLFATQAIGQVRAALGEADRERWGAVITLLESAELSALRRDFEAGRRLLQEALSGLS